jgi:hypothetical protein
MRKSSVKSIIKSPIQLAAVCYMVYLASSSFFVMVLLLIGGAAYAKKILRDAVRGTKDDVKEPAAHESEDELQASAVVPVEPTPIRKKYAKSAVVIDIKTGTRD